MKRKRPKRKRGSHYELQEQGEALFHQWGRDTRSDEDGSFSTAIIELEDGTVKNIPAEQVRFISGEIREAVNDDINEKTIEFAKTPRLGKGNLTVFPSIAECLEFKQQLIDEQKTKGDL